MPIIRHLNIKIGGEIRVVENVSIDNPLVRQVLEASSSIGLVKCTIDHVTVELSHALGELAWPPDPPTKADLEAELTESQIQFLSERIDEQELPVRVIRNLTKRASWSHHGFTYVWEVSEYTLGAIGKRTHFGRTSVKQFRELLQRYGLDYGLKDKIDQIRDQLPQP